MAARELSAFLGSGRFATVMADPPWRFLNRTGKVAPEHRRLSRYETLSVGEIGALPVADHLEATAHCYLWCPNALLPEGLQVLAAWGFTYKANLVWHKVRKGRTVRGTEAAPDWRPGRATPARTPGRAGARTTAVRAAAAMTPRRTSNTATPSPPGSRAP